MFNIFTGEMLASSCISMQFSVTLQLSCHLVQCIKSNTYLVGFNKYYDLQY